MQSQFCLCRVYPCAPPSQKRARVRLSRCCHGNATTQLCINDLSASASVLSHCRPTANTLMLLMRLRVSAQFGFSSSCRDPPCQVVVWLWFCPAKWFVHSHADCLCHAGHVVYLHVHGSVIHSIPQGSNAAPPTHKTQNQPGQPHWTDEQCEQASLLFDINLETPQMLIFTEQWRLWLTISQESITLAFILQY